MGQLSLAARACALVSGRPLRGAVAALVEDFARAERQLARHRARLAG
jgi:hypothetical protein